MAGNYHSTPVRRTIDRVMAALARRGLAPGGITELTVTGRRSGEPRTLPVTPITVEDKRYLVAPYGPVGWVTNLRAAGEGSLRRGGKVQHFRARELDEVAAAPVLRRYVQLLKVVRPYVDAGPGDDLAAFEAIAGRHPVFLVQAD